MTTTTGMIINQSKPVERRASVFFGMGAAMTQIDQKDRINWLMKQYESECSDNTEIYRRGPLLVTLNTVVGTLLFALFDRAVGATITAWGVVAITLLTLVTVALSVSIVFLFLALWPRDWEFIDPEDLNTKTEEEIRSALRNCIDANRDINGRRFSYFQSALLCSMICLVFLALAAALAAGTMLSS